MWGVRLRYQFFQCEKIWGVEVGKIKSDQVLMHMKITVLAKRFIKRKYLAIQ